LESILIVVSIITICTTFATLLDERGSSAKETQQLCRHSTPVITMSRYTRTRQDRIRNVVEDLGELLKNNPMPQGRLNDQEPELCVLKTRGVKKLIRSILPGKSSARHRLTQTSHAPNRLTLC
jgi:hypothetical protein